MSTVQPEEGRGKQAAREHRTASLAHWEEAASGWVARQATLRELSAPVSHWMIDAVDPQPGQRVLELAAGLGETGFLAAEMVAPVGGVITSDQADAMLDGARKRAGELNLTNVEFQVLNAEWIDLPVASVDVVFCRWGYMLMVDPLAALTETRRVLRPEGHVALAAWDAIEHNPWAQFPAAVFEIAHQFSLFCVNRDDRLFSPEISLDLAVDVFKLGIPVGMARPFVSLAVGLQTVL